MPQVDPLDVVLLVKVVPPVTWDAPGGGARARAAVLPVRGLPPRELRWRTAGWAAPLAGLHFIALDAGPGGRSSWRAAYLGHGGVGSRRALAMAGTLSLLRRRAGQLERLEGRPGSLAQYLERAARALGIGGAVPLAFPSPPGQDRIWTRCNASALQAWLDAGLGPCRGTTNPAAQAITGRETVRHEPPEPGM